MKVVELKEELGERGEALSGNKAWLRRRLHARRYSERVFGERRGRCRRVEPYVECPKFSRACGGATFTILPRAGPLLSFCPKSTASRAFSVLTQIGRTFRIPSDYGRHAGIQGRPALGGTRSS